MTEFMMFCGCIVLGLTTIIFVAFSVWCVIYLLNDSYEEYKEYKETDITSRIDNETSSNDIEDILLKASNDKYLDDCHKIVYSRLHEIVKEYNTIKHYLH